MTNQEEQIKELMPKDAELLSVPVNPEVEKSASVRDYAKLKHWNEYLILRTVRAISQFTIRHMLDLGYIKPEVADGMILTEEEIVSLFHQYIDDPASNESYGHYVARKQAAKFSGWVKPPATEDELREQVAGIIKEHEKCFSDVRLGVLVKSPSTLADSIIPLIRAYAVTEERKKIGKWLFFKTEFTDKTGPSLGKYVRVYTDESNSLISGELPDGCQEIWDAGKQEPAESDVLVQHPPVKDEGELVSRDELIYLLNERFADWTESNCEECCSATMEGECDIDGEKIEGREFCPQMQEAIECAADAILAKVQSRQQVIYYCPGCSEETTCEPCVKNNSNLLSELESLRATVKQMWEALEDSQRYLGIYAHLDNVARKVKDKVDAALDQQQEGK